MLTISAYTQNTFWKGESEVKASITEGAHTYRSSIYLKHDQVFDYSCSCQDGNSYKGMCRHCSFLYEEWKRRKKEETSPPVFTSQEIRTMIREYTNREVAEIMAGEEESCVFLRPRLLLERTGISLEFDVGKDRPYLVKDLALFADAVEHGTMVRYGKNLEFYHSLSAFDQDSRALAEFLLDLIHSYLEYHAHFSKGGTPAAQNMRSIRLNRGDMDRFVQLMMDRTVEAEESSGIRRQVLITEELPSFEIQIEKAGRDGICIKIPDDMDCIRGETAVYLLSHRSLCRLTGKRGRDLWVFLEQAVRKNRGNRLFVNDRDIPLFYERVLRKLLPYGIVREDGVKLEEYRPEELKARFFFDSPDSNQITMEPLLSYGDFSFHPVEDENVPRTVCRDVPGEFKVSQVITRYFSYREEDGKTLVIRNDEEGIYRLLTEGIEEFKELGEVMVSARMERVKILPPPAVSIGVSYTGNWLDLKIDVDGMDRQELLKVLERYQQKKPYYRLKSGEFLELKDDGLLTVSRMMEGLSLTKAQMQEGVMRVPGYRAFYLNSILEARQGMTVYRDRMFKSLVRGIKAVEDSDFEVPETLQDVLREYQKFGFKWLKTLKSMGFGGILADDMGLGKTVQVIAFLIDEKKRNGEGKPALIVCPASLVYNWESEIEKFGACLKTLVIAGNAEERKLASRKIRQCDVVITSYDLLKRDLEWYQDIEFESQFIDEAQYIKNAGTLSAKAVKAIHSASRFALTGTPMENRLGELWSIFDYLMPGFLFSYAKFRREYEIPIAREGNRDALRQLRQLIGPFILRRLKQQVLMELPEKMETVVYSKAEGVQKELYAASASLLKEKLETGEEGDKIQILAALTRLRQICCHPSLCYSHYRAGSAKLETCVDLVKNGIAGNHKILLFSQFTSMLELIGKRLDQENISYYCLTGETPKEERLHLVNAFGQDSTQVFLISLKAGGTGLNLTAADMVIHYDPWWNVAAQNQATDRAYRIGQDKKVTVFRLIMKDTVEENIEHLQRMKQNLADDVIKEGTINLASLSREDMLAILGK